jgi:Uma2 family endonuclease
VVKKGGILGHSVFYPIFFVLFQRSSIFVQNKLIMSTAIASVEKERPKKRLVTLEKFLERYNNREDPFKYEWNKGTIEKKNRTMNRDQYLIVEILTDLLYRIKDKNKRGFLGQEVDMYLPSIDRTRRADIAYLTRDLMELSKDNRPIVCPFVIEVISKNDQINEVDEKIIEYFENDVKVVWVIFPKLKKVEVYTSIRDVKICFDNDICSANPVMDDFNISVNDLFA